MAVPQWIVSGTYFEACNCEAPCPCRKLGDRTGQRSTYATCDFALSWSIKDGHFDRTALAGLNVAMAGRWDNAEPAKPGFPAIRPPWHVMLYVDERATPAQRQALSAIFLGQAGGTAFQNYAKLIGEVYDVKPGRIELDHTPGRQSIRLASAITVETARKLELDEPITCGISGHDHPGTELVARRLIVDDQPLRFSFEGRCAFATAFDYHSDA
jgi:hypothetical protein